MKKYLHSLFLLVGLLCLWPVYADEQSINPGINLHYRDPDFQVWVERFEREGREVYDLREKIADAAGVERGMVVADIGAGTGLFSRLFAQRVGESGTVYAVDISEEFVRNIVRLAREQGLANIVGIVNSGKGSGLPTKAVDIVFTCDTYHHFEYPQSMLASIRTAMKADGRLVIIDYSKDPAVSSDCVLGHVRADKQTVIREIEQAGFELAKEFDFLRQNYFLVFRKK